MLENYHLFYHSALPCLVLGFAPDPMSRLFHFHCWFQGDGLLGAAASGEATTLNKLELDNEILDAC